MLAQEPLRWPPKDPSDKADFTLNWSEELKVMGDNDTILQTVWTVPQGLVLESQNQANGETSVWLSGGTAGQDYMIACRVTTSAGRIFERSVWLKVQNK